MGPLVEKVPAFSMTTHQGQAGAEDPGWETSVQGARCQQRAEDSKGKWNSQRKALITLMAHMKLRKLDSRGTKRSPRWDKDASADFRVKEGCLRSTEVKARSRQEYNKNHESGKLASSLSPKGNMLRKNSKDILV